MSGQVIGIVGGGQLGRMLTLAALPLGFKVVVLDPTPHCPAAQAGAKQIKADLYDKEALGKLADAADWLTVEIEHLDAKTLETIAKLGKPINPSPQTIRLIQDKLAQKNFLHDADVPIAPFIEITDKASAVRAFRAFGGKIVIKTRFGGYDGRGNMVVDKPEDIDTALKHFKGKKLYAEQFIPFRKELAAMVARSIRNEVVTYPIVETIHERNICVEVLVPAGITKQQRDEAEHIALSVAHRLEGAGTFGIEMFLAEDGRILVNEIAPRVHNSGHYTLEAARTSQFEQHIRAITGLPLGDPDLVVPAAAMINVLGERDGPVKLAGLGKVLATPHTSLHIYGKSPTKVDRKMGHITATGQTVAEARQRAQAARDSLQI